MGEKLQQATKLDLSQVVIPTKLQKYHLPSEKASTVSSHETVSLADNVPFARKGDESLPLFIKRGILAINNPSSNDGEVG